MPAIEAYSPNDTMWLGDYVAALRRRKWSILAIAILALLAAVAYAQQQTPIYQSTATVLSTDTIVQSQAQSAEASPPNMQTEAAIVASEPSAECVASIERDPAFRRNPAETSPDVERLCSDKGGGTDVAPRELTDALSVSIPSQSSVLAISYSDPDPRLAWVRAQAFALAYVHVRTSQATALLDQLRKPLLEARKNLSNQVAQLQARIAKALAGSAPVDQPRLVDLTSRRSDADQRLGTIESQLQNLDPSKINPPQVLVSATLPRSPVSPDKPLIALSGLLVGIVLGLAFALVRERIDDRIRGGHDLEWFLGAPTLAVVPRLPGRRKGPVRLAARDERRTDVAEAYRTLRARVLAGTPLEGGRSFLVCSPGPGDGATTTAANLAWVLAEAGRRVVAISADLRTPRLNDFFGLDNSEGLSSVLAGRVEAWKAVAEAGPKTLRVLVSGPKPEDPSELLQSPRMPEVLAGFRGVADFVIVDAPPVLGLGDALSLAPLVDEIILVADARTTSRKMVVRARDQLEQVGGRVVGGVLNGYDPKKAGMDRPPIPSPGAAPPALATWRRPAMSWVEGNGGSSARAGNDVEAWPEDR